MSVQIVPEGTRVILVANAAEELNAQLAEVVSTPDPTNASSDVYAFCIDVAYREESDRDGTWCEGGREVFITLEEQQARKDVYNATGDGPEPEGLLDADTCWAIGLDPTGRDGDPRHPYTIFDLTDAERDRLVEHLKASGHV